MILLTDRKMAELAKSFNPHYNIVDLDYFKVNGNLYLPSTVMPNVANYLDMDDSEVDLKDPVLQKLISLTQRA